MTKNEALKGAIEILVLALEVEGRLKKPEQGLIELKKIGLKYDLKETA